MTSEETKQDASIFICWSGRRSKQLANAVRTLLCEMLSLRAGQVFVSDELEKGTTWFGSIMGQLRTSKAGVVCLTAENLDSSWVHFEAGALASHFSTAVAGSEHTDTRLFTLLHDVKVAELKGPLSAYQATNTTRQD